MTIHLRLTGLQYQSLRKHLYPGDNKEAVALILCGRRSSCNREILAARTITPIPYDLCRERTAYNVTWSTELLIPLLEEASRRNLAIVKVHSHPGGYSDFSICDDKADQALFSSIPGWIDGPGPHASVIMLPEGNMFGRAFWPSGETEPIASILVAGDDILIWNQQLSESKLQDFAQRHTQAFGAGTIVILERLSIAVIGCSGTGGPVIEQLSRLGVGKLVLIDPDCVEIKNLNRIPNTTMADARLRRPKVEVLAKAISAMELGSKVITFQRSLFDPEVVRTVAECDIIFGCMDSVDGRHLLNRLSIFYNLPYFDLGVKLQADGFGGVNQICGTVHYLQPDRSSLFSRGVYTLEQVRAAGMKRTSPEEYKEQVRSKYINGVFEERPAVVSVNSLISSLAINELLARLHPYRDDENSRFATYRISLTQAQLYTEAEGEPCKLLSRHVGRGDLKPLLDLPELDALEVKDEMV